MIAHCIWNIVSYSNCKEND